MSIKSDKGIRHMAETTGMIEPFEPGQIRQQDGKKIISYGTSSYDIDFFTVYGQVLRQGKYELPADEDITISQAILRSGG